MSDKSTSRHLSPASVGDAEAVRADRKAWSDPASVEMDISRYTAGFPGVGGDGGNYADCTLS